MNDDSNGSDVPAEHMGYSWFYGVVGDSLGEDRDVVVKVRPSADGDGSQCFYDFDFSDDLLQNERSLCLFRTKLSALEDSLQNVPFDGIVRGTYVFSHADEMPSKVLPIARFTALPSLEDGIEVMAQTCGSAPDVLLSSARYVLANLSQAVDVRLVQMLR